MKGSKAMDLTGEWLFRVDPGNKDQNSDFTDDDPDLKDWTRVRVPCGFGQCVQGVAKFDGVGWFRKEFDIPETWRDKRLCLTFDAVNNSATFYLNNQLLGESKDPYLPIRFDLQSEVCVGQKNALVVRVDHRPKGNVPYPGGWYNEGGILRAVRLEEIGDVHFDDLAVVAPAPETNVGKADLTLEISNKGSTGVASVARVDISDSGGKIVGTASAPARLDSGKMTKISLPVSVPGAVAWSPASPALYSVCVRLETGGTVVSEAVTRFGFRTVAARDGQVLLNGYPIYMVGFNRHEDTPETGMARNTEMAREDLQRMKTMGVNCVRGSHYPPDEGLLDLCDEMGILHVADMPVHLTGSNTEEAAHYLTRRIRKDRNHPSVIFWSVSNEADEQTKDVVAQNDALIRLARKLDPTRLSVHVSERGRWVNPENHPLFAEDDVICLNGYPSELGRFWKRDRSYNFSKSTDYWKTELAKLHQRYPDKPILVTEFGYPTTHALRPSIDGELGPRMQKNTIEAEFDAFDAPYICGALIWVWADHPWPKGKYQNETSPYGIFTRDRQGKGADVEEAIENMFKERLKSRMPLDRRAGFEGVD